MKNKKNIKFIVVLLSLFLVSVSAFFISCSKEENKESIQISNESISLEIGQSFTLSVSGSFEGEVVWGSSNTAVATVSNLGVVTAYASGSAEITAKVGDQKVKCAVEVKTQPVTTDKILMISSPELNLKVGESKQLEITCLNLTGSAVWSTEEEQIISVENGKITALSAGRTVVTVTLGGLTDSCIVTVADAIEIILEKPNDYLLCNMSREMLCALYINGNKADSNLLSWTSSNPEVIEVQKGVVTAKIDGVAVVSASYEGVSASIEYEVKQTISTVDDFKNIKLTGRYILANDIDFNNVAIESIAPYLSTTADGANSVSSSYLQVNMFQGSIDGNGYALKNVDPWGGIVDGKSDPFHSLMGCIGENGVVKNLSIYGRTATRSGNCALLSAFNFGTVENVYAELTVYKDGSNGSNQIAPLIIDNRGTVKNCITSVIVDSSINAKELYFVSSMFGKLIRNCHVENCFAYNSYTNMPLIGEMGNTSSYSIIVLNSEKYNSEEDLIMNANLSSYDKNIWSISYTSAPKLINNYLKI